MVKMPRSPNLTLRLPSNARMKSRKTVHTGKCRALHPRYSSSIATGTESNREKRGIGASLLLFLQTGRTGWALAELWQLLSSVQVLCGRNEPQEQPLNLIYVCLNQCAHADLCPSESAHLWLPAEVWGSKCGPVSVSCRGEYSGSDFVRDPR